MNSDTIQILRAHMHKVTPARRVILEVFSDQCNPISADEVCRKVKKHKIDLVTIYRTLALFQKSGLVRKVFVSEHALHYERNLNDHHHIICTQCKKVSDFIGCRSQELIGNALKQVKDFKLVSSHSFDLFGVCNACAK